MTKWDSIWRGADIVAADELIRGGMIAVKDGKIAYIGEAIEGTARETHDVSGTVITAGLVDCHTHLIFGGNRAGEFEQRLEGVSYAEISAQGGGIRNTVAATRKASEEELFQSAHARAQELIRGGVTTLEIKSGYGLDLENERKMLKVAARLERELPLTIQKTYLAAHALPPEYEGRRQNYMDHVVEEALPALISEGLVDAVDGFCENIAFSAEEIDRIFEAAQGLPVKLHAEQLSHCGGTQVAAKHKALSADHLEYVAEDDVRAMKDADMVAVLLPGAYYFLQETKKPPLDLFRKYNVPMALATDCNPGSSPILSLPLIMNMACTLYGMTPKEALEGVTINGAKALGLEKGVLEAGRDADFVVWDVKEPAEICYWVGASKARYVVFDGSISSTSGMK